jgi:hypothetical protein
MFYTIAHLPDKHSQNGVYLLGRDHPAEHLEHLDKQSTNWVFSEIRLQEIASFPLTAAQ